MIEFRLEKEELIITEEYEDRDWHSGYPITSTRKLHLTTGETKQLKKLLDCLKDK